MFRTTDSGLADKLARELFDCVNFLRELVK